MVAEVQKKLNDHWLSKLKYYLKTGSGGGGGSYCGGGSSGGGGKRIKVFYCFFNEIKLLI